MGQVNCEKKLALAWSQQQSQALAGLQGCLGLCRWQVPTGLNLPPLDTIPACQGSQLGRVSSETPVPVGNRMVPGTLMSTCQQRLAAWEARVAPVCTGPLCSIPAGVGWQQPQHLRVSVEDSLPGLRSYPAGCQQVVRHRRHSTGQRVSFQCTACIWQCSQCLPGLSECAAAPPTVAGLCDIAVHSPLGAGTSHQGRLIVPSAQHG